MKTQAAPPASVLDGPEDNDWPETLKTELRQLWADGHTTAVIGHRLGVSKNAVCGKAHRLHLPARPNPVQRGIVRADKKPPGQKTPPRPVGDRPDSTRFVPKVTGLKRVRRGRAKQAMTWTVSPRHSCRFPMWDDSEQPTHVYCGCPVVMRPTVTFADGTVVRSTRPAPYCGPHYRDCYEVRKPDHT